MLGAIIVLYLGWLVLLFYWLGSAAGSASSFDNHSCHLSLPVGLLSCHISPHLTSILKICILSMLNDKLSHLFHDFANSSFIPSVCLSLVDLLSTDDYLVPALQNISESLHIPPDVAGLTFMALGNGAPGVSSFF